MKIKYKSKRFIASVVTVLLVGLGVAKPELIAPVVTELTCNMVACES